MHGSRIIRSILFILSSLCISVFRISIDIYLICPLFNLIWTYFSIFFPRLLKWELRLQVWDFSAFLMYTYSATYFHFGTCLAVLHKFRYVIFLFSFSSVYFLICLRTSCLANGLFRSTLFSCQMPGDFPVVFLLLISSLFWLYIHSVWLQFLKNFLGFVLWLKFDLSWHMFHRHLKRMWILLLWAEHSINIYLFLVVDDAVQFFYMLTYFPSSGSRTSWARCIKSLVITVDFYLSVLSVFASHILKLCCLVHIQLGLLCSHVNWHFYNYITSLSVSGSFLCPEIYFIWY